MPRDGPVTLVGVDPRIAAITSRQLGLVTRRQLSELGIGRHAVAHLVLSGRLVRVTERVLILAGVALTPHTQALCGTLDCDGVVSGRSGVALWGAPHTTLLPVHATRLRGGRVRPSHVAVVHEPRQLLDEHITERSGIPVMRPHRLMFDIAGSEPPGRVVSILDWFWSRRLVNIPGLDRTLRQVAVRGRSGVALMRELIDERRHLTPPGSNLELRFETIVRRAALPPFERQVNLGNDDEWLGRMDFFSTERLLVIESTPSSTMQLCPIGNGTKLDGRLYGRRGSW